MKIYHSNMNILVCFSSELNGWTSDGVEEDEITFLNKAHRLIWTETLKKFFIITICKLKWTTRRIMCGTVLFIVYEILRSFCWPLSFPSSYFPQVPLFNSMILKLFHSIFQRCSAFPQKRWTNTKYCRQWVESSLFLLYLFL